jgi:hypothetical protein
MIRSGAAGVASATLPSSSAEPRSLKLGRYGRICWNMDEAVVAPWTIRAAVT